MNLLALIRSCAAVAIAAALLLLASPSAGAESWKAGAAKADITPTAYMWMAGYAARTHAADSKMTDLWAKALVLEDAVGKRGVLITLDLVGIDRELSASLCEKLHEKYGLERSQIAINCSHTHSGPVVAKNLRPMHEYSLEKAQRDLIHQYAAKLETDVVAAVGRAIESLAPAEVAWASGKTDFAVNRRANKEADVPALREQGKLLGPSDHDVPVLAVRNAQGKLLAAAFGYACHATVLSGYEWSGDYPGFAQIGVEAAHPECVALFWAGCGGDQNPIPRRTRELAEKYGKRLADEVNRVLAGPLTNLAPRLEASYVEAPLAFAKLPTRDELAEQMKDANKYIAMRAKMLLEEVDAGRPLAATYPYPVQLWRLGSEIDWHFLGGEVVVDYAVRIKAEGRGEKTWVAGYSNDVMAYIPSRRVLIEGGYEGGGAMVYYGQPTVWSDQVETTIIAAIAKQGGGKE